jgi:hypothetical protein
VVNGKEVIVLERSISVDEHSNSSPSEHCTASALSECEKGEKTGHLFPVVTERIIFKIRHTSTFCCKPLL